VLFSRRDLEGIAAGEVTLAFRRWATPRVRPGSRQVTRAGVVEFTAVERVAPSRITAAEARRAGQRDRAALLRMLARARPEEPVWRVELRLVGEDPRIALRADVDPVAVAAVRARLDAIDARSARGPWTREILTLIAERPGVRAPDLAAALGRETAPFKADVRRLKALGLTESLEVGYRLAPRGRAVLSAEPAAP
jgi:hypothetical protein